MRERLNQKGGWVPPRVGRPGGALLGACLLFSVPCLSQGQPPTIADRFNIARSGHLWLVPVVSVADVWVNSGYAFVARQRFGLGIVDIRGPESPRLIGSFNIGAGILKVNDVKVEDSRAYVSNEGDGLPLYILDVSDPTSPRVLGGIPRAELYHVHNLVVENHIAYVVGNFELGWQTYVYDLTDPGAPVRLATLPHVGAHDVTLVGDRLYEAGGWSGLHVWDVANPASPKLIVSADQNNGPRPHYHTHNVWPSEDGRFLYTTNEVASDAPGAVRSGALKIWEWVGASELVQVGAWQAEPGMGDSLITIHNVVVHGNRAFVSYYQAGIRVLDLSDPRDPVEVAFFDTYPGRPRELFQGCWGVFPIDDRRICVSDRVTGLHILEYNGAERATLAGEVLSAATGQPIPGALVVDRSAARTVLAEDGSFRLATGAGRHLLTVSAPGHGAVEREVELSGGVLAILRVELPEASGTHASAAPVPPPVAFLGNHPNPLRRGTALEIEAGTHLESVDLAVYDVLGRRVAGLGRGPLAAGRHRFEWSGTDEEGRAVPDGVYFARVSGAGPIVSHRMLVLR